MADPIDTGKKTVTGRTIWRDPKTGEDYSERSTTFEIDGIYYTMPTVAEDGSQYTDDQIRDYVKKYGPSDYLTGEELPKFKSQEDAIEYAISRSDTRKKKEEPMLGKQMEMFNEGGLKDEGGEVDPVSGNDVPIGSTKEEVRDDIPAMVSEGEFVFPADVVRYIGLNNLMNMRQEAKMGLKKMEAMGQMGNGDEATLPDDMPFGMADIVIVEGSDEPKEMAQGGVIQAQTGKFITPMFNPSDRDNREYKNAKGESLFIPFLNGQPVYPIPEGYFPVGQVPTETTPETPAPAEDSGDGGRDDGPRVNAFTEAGSWAGSPLDMYIKEADKVTTYGNIASGVGAAFNPLIGGFMAVAIKNEKRKIIATIDDRIEQAKTEEDKEQLKDIKARLTDPERKGILGKAINSVFDGIKDSLGLSKEEQEVAENVTKKTINTDTNEPDNTTQKDIEEITKVSIDEPTTEEQMLAASGALDADYAGEKIDPADAEIASIGRPRDEFGQVGLSDPEKEKEIDLTGFETLQRRTVPSFFRETGRTPIVEPAPKALQVTGGVGEIKTRRDDIRAYIESIKDPETAADALNNVTNTINSTAKPMQFSKRKSDTEKQTDEVLESGPVIKDTISPGVIADKPNLSAAQETKDRKRRKKQRREKQKAASKALSSFDKNVAGVKSKAGLKNKAAQAGIKKEADKIKSKLEQQEKGITTGFKKGGLASRK